VEAAPDGADGEEAEVGPGVGVMARC